ncbi:hypothetical protein M3Y98_00293500 [Aphelenchoides besseyi]|nr:hypothetical protein M3Y98_00293500 [Aphelenchoides besseyi]
MDFTTIGLTDETTEQASTLQQEVLTTSVGLTETVTRGSLSPETIKEILTTESISLSTSLPFERSTSSAPSRQETTLFVMSSKKPEDHDLTTEYLSSYQPKETTEVGVRRTSSVEPEASSTTPLILNRHIIAEEATSQLVAKEVNELSTEEPTVTNPTESVHGLSQATIKITSNSPQHIESVSTEEPISTNYSPNSTLETVPSSTGLLDFSNKPVESTSTQSTSEETAKTKASETQTPSSKSAVDETKTQATTESSDSEEFTTKLLTSRLNELTKTVESERATTVPIIPEQNTVASISSKPDSRETEGTKDFGSTNRPKVSKASTQFVEFTTSDSKPDETMYSTTSTIELREKTTETELISFISSSTEVNDLVQSTTLQSINLVPESTRVTETPSTIVNTINPTTTPFEYSTIDSETPTTSEATVQSSLSTETLDADVTTSISSENVSSQSSVINEQKPVIETSTILADKSEIISSVGSTRASKMSTSSPNEFTMTSTQSENSQPFTENIPTIPTDEVFVQLTTLSIATPNVEIDGDENTEEESGSQRLPTTSQTKGIETTFGLQSSTEPVTTVRFTEPPSSTLKETFVGPILANKTASSSSASTSMPSTQTFGELLSTQTTTIASTNLPEDNLAEVSPAISSTQTNDQNEITGTSLPTQSTTENTNFIQTIQSQITRETSNAFTENISGSTVKNTKTTWDVETKQSSEQPTTRSSFIRTDHTPEPTDGASSTTSEFQQSTTTLQPLAETISITSSSKSETSDENVFATSESTVNPLVTSTIVLPKVPAAFDFTEAVKQESVTASNVKVDSSVRSDKTTSSHVSVDEIESTLFTSTTPLPEETVQMSTSQSIRTETQLFTAQPDLIITAKPTDLEITTQHNENVAEVSTPLNVPVSNEPFKALTQSISLGSSTLSSEIHLTTNIEVSLETSTVNSKVKDVTLIPEPTTGFVNQHFESSIQPTSTTRSTSMEDKLTENPTAQNTEYSISTTGSVTTESKTTENVQTTTSTESVENRESSVTSSSFVSSSISTETASTSSVEQHSTPTSELSVSSESPFAVRFVTTPKSRVSVRTTTSDSRLISSEQTTRPNGCMSSNECGLDAICNRTIGACECRAGFEPIKLPGQLNIERKFMSFKFDNS